MQKAEMQNETGDEAGMTQLETKRLLLRPFTEGDAADLYEYAKDPKVGLPAGWPPHKSMEESREIIRTVFAAPNTFAVVDRASGKVIGSAGFTGKTREEFPQKNDELGYALSPAFWGRGLMPEAVSELLRYAFGEMGLAAVWCSHYADNPQSQRVIEKSGFSFRMEETVVDGPTGQEKPTKFYVLTREMWESRP